MNWYDSWVAFDTETTGLGTSAKIVEVAVVTFENLVPVHAWSTLIHPGVFIDWNDARVCEALAVNKLTREDLEDKPTFEQILPQLLLELSSNVYVAHNAEFDLRMIDQELARLNKPKIQPPLVVCTKNLASVLDTTKGRNRLQDVSVRYGIEQSQAHRAADDARVCGMVLAEMYKRGQVPIEDAAMRALCTKADLAWKGKHRW